MTALQKFIDDCKSNIDKLDSEGVVFNLSDYLETAIKIIEMQRETLNLIAGEVDFYDADGERLRSLSERK